MKIRINWSPATGERDEWWEDTPALRRLIARGIVSEIRHRPESGHNQGSELRGILSSDERVALPQ